MSDRQALQNAKQAIRQRIRDARRALDPDWIEETSLAIQRRILQLDLFKKAHVVSCYMALPREVQTEALIVASWEQDKKVCVPCFNEAQNSYAWAWLEPGDETRLTHWQVPELETIRWVEDAEPQVIITPAVAVDPTGRRLGHGGGHYDRLLHGSTTRRISPVFEFQVMEAIPVEEWDERIHIIVTEKNDLQTM